ncbi:TPA: hypothetical protein OH201_002043 [Staphylococcus aureus]|nr:hypothetical protein [Staphylococcus aureus]
MKIDYNEINIEPEDIYLEMRKMGLDFELKEEYKFLEANNSSLKSKSFSLFSVTENIESKEKEVGNFKILDELYKYYKLNTYFSIEKNRDDSEIEENYVEFQNLYTEDSLVHINNAEKDGRLMMAI